MTASYDTPAFRAMLQFTATANEAGWNTLVRDVPNRPGRRMMDGVRDGVWFRLSAGDDPRATTLRVRSLAPGSLTVSFRPDQVDSFLTGPTEAWRNGGPATPLKPSSLPVALQ